ncbi:hypothetical protein T484DRAFT_1987757, partial [Baffinella frigidus]
MVKRINQQPTGRVETPRVRQTSRNSQKNPSGKRHKMVKLRKGSKAVNNWSCKYVAPGKAAAPRIGKINYKPPAPRIGQGVASLSRPVKVLFSARARVATPSDSEEEECGRVVSTYDGFSDDSEEFVPSFLGLAKPPGASKDVMTIFQSGDIGKRCVVKYNKESGETPGYYVCHIKRLLKNRFAAPVRGGFKDERGDDADTEWCQIDFGEPDAPTG